MTEYAALTSINPITKYTLDEIWKNNLIPRVNSYTTIYNLVTEKRVQINGIKKYTKRKLQTITTPQTLKAVHDGSPWGKIRGKILVEGKEIILFRKINNFL